VDAVEGGGGNVALAQKVPFFAVFSHGAASEDPFSILDFRFSIERQPHAPRKRGG